MLQVICSIVTGLLVMGCAVRYAATLPTEENQSCLPPDARRASPAARAVI